jgi:tRNA(Arg) A34 adenosine deaminase TadA
MVQESLRAALEAALAGNYGIGSAVVHDSRVVAYGQNGRRIDGPMQDIAHAEIDAVLQSRPYRKKNAHAAHEMTIGATIEPCPLCTIAIVNAHIRETVVGMPDPGGTFVLQSPEILPRDFQAIWEKHDMSVRLAEIPDAMRLLCWELFLETRHRLHQVLHQTE